MKTPLEQFTIKPFLRIYNNWLDLTISNTTIYMIITILLIIKLLEGSINNKIITNKWNRLIEIYYIKIEELINEIIGKKYNKYIPLIFSLFLFILINNLIGLVPYSFTTTSHIIITLTMSLSIIIGTTIIGFKKHSINFFKLFIPNGLNQGLMKLSIPLIFSIEIISYLSRIISLSVRLAANLMSGHTLLKIVTNFGFQYSFFFPYVFLLIPILLLIIIYILEIAVSFIQAYVFILLTTTYIRDVELLH